MKDLISYQIVTPSSVTSTCTGKAVIAIPVHNLITEGAVILCLIDWSSKSALDHCSVQQWIRMCSKGFCRYCVQPRSCTTGGGKVQMGFKIDVVGGCIFYAIQSVAVYFLG